MEALLAVFHSLWPVMSELFLSVAAGAIFGKVCNKSVANSKILTDMILFVVLPCNIINAGANALSIEVITLFQLVGLGLLVQALSVGVAFILYRRVPMEQKAILQYAVLVPNAGFIGIPLVRGVFGDNALALLSFYMLPFRFVMWIAMGVFSREVKIKLMLKKILLHPCMIATYISYMLMFGVFDLPDTLSYTVESFSNATSPLTLFFVGTVFSNIGLKDLVTKQILSFSIMRLVLFPLGIFILLTIMNVNPLWTGFIVLLAGTPAGSTTSILAAQYNLDKVMAGRLVVVSTALSLITIPIWSIFLVYQLG